MFELKPLKKPGQQQQPRKTHKLFSADDEDEPASGPNHKLPSAQFIASEQAKNSHKKMLESASKYLEEDPSIYSYDSHYDQINDKRKELEEIKRQKKGSRYIQGMNKAAEERKTEQSMIYEKIAEKELKREGQEAAGQKYVTSSYKKLMSEGQKFLERDAAKEEYNKLHSAENKDNMLGLYKTMYQNDIFAGGYRPDLGTLINHPQKADAQAKPSENEQKLPEPQQQPPEEARPEPVRSQQETAMTMTEERNVRKPAEESARPRRIDEREREKEARHKKRETSRSRSRSRSKSPVRAPEIKEPEVKKESKEDKLKSAKERYLQRKLNQAAGPVPTADQTQV